MDKCFGLITSSLKILSILPSISRSCLPTLLLLLPRVLIYISLNHPVKISLLDFSYSQLILEITLCLTYTTQIFPHLVMMIVAIFLGKTLKLDFHFTNSRSYRPFGLVLVELKPVSTSSTKLLSDRLCVTLISSLYL